MKQRHPNFGRGFELLRRLPAVRTFREGRLEVFPLFIRQVARGRDGAQFQESSMWSRILPLVAAPMIPFIFHAVALRAPYSQTSASATYRVRGSSGAAHFPRAAQASD